MAKQPEDKIVQKIIKELNALPMCRAEKVHGSMYGHCKLDIDGAINGYAFKIEVKRPGNKPTDRQSSTIKKWQDVGVMAGWATNVEEAKDIIKGGHHE